MNHASLFSGIGGPEIAAAMLGWDNVFHCEINDFGRKILEYWFPNSQSYEDIKTTNFKQWRGKVDVLTGGFPCQPFSYAGQRRGADAGETSRLSPLFTEEMMGFPLMWTTLPFLSQSGEPNPSKPTATQSSPKSCTKSSEQSK